MTRTTDGSGAPPLGVAECAALFERFFAPRPQVLLAVSGGADSTALLVLAAEWAHKRDRPQLFVATVDHGLRAEAAAVEAPAAQLAVTGGDASATPLLLAAGVFALLAGAGAVAASGMRRRH